MTRAYLSWDVLSIDVKNLEICSQIVIELVLKSVLEIGRLKHLSNEDCF